MWLCTTHQSMYATMPGKGSESLSMKERTKERKQIQFLSTFLSAALQLILIRDYRGLQNQLGGNTQRSEESIRVNMNHILSYHVAAVSHNFFIFFCIDNTNANTNALKFSVIFVNIRVRKVQAAML